MTSAEDFAYMSSYILHEEEMTGQLTPPRPSMSPVCPPAPVRFPLTEDDIFPAPSPSPAPACIEAGEWIKPDPAMTRLETRKYILEETVRYLTGRICKDASEASDSDTPVGRLRRVVAALEESAMGAALPRELGDRFDWAGRWSAYVCVDALRGYEPVIPAAVLAAGFVNEDLLPCGRTIASYWNRSPFEALRAASPLSDEEPEAEAEAEAETETETETESPSIDDRVQSVQDILLSEYEVRFKAHGWMLAAIFAVFLAYFAAATAALSRVR